MEKTAGSFEFAYLQLYSQLAPFGGLSGVPELVEAVARFSADGNRTDKGLAAALTDTFSLAGAHEWRARLEETSVTPLIGAELGVSWPGGGVRTLPASLILLPQSLVGYHNLCRLISSGLANAGTAGLTAYVTPDILSSYREGLIAIAPYYGGPVTAALRIKPAEAKNRAQNLRDIFGPTNFYLGAPPPAGQPVPNTTIEHYEARFAGAIKLNAALVRLARDLKIELIATGEARYLAEENAAAYGAMRSRLNRVLAQQFSPAQLQQPHDWLYYNRADRPTADLQLHSPETLLNHYNEQDWPGALANNRAVAARCTKWHFSQNQPLTELRQRCEAELERRYTDPEGALPEAEQTQVWLESELADIEELGLAGALLTAASAQAAANEVREIVIARRLSGSLVAYLLGLSERPPEVTDGDSFQFAFEEGSRPLRLEVGRQGRARLLAALNSGATGPEEWKAAPVASPAAEPGGPALLHPRQIALSIAKASLGDMTPLQPAIEMSNGTLLRNGAQLGRNFTPPGIYRLEVIESSGVARLQLAFDILNEWRLREGLAPLQPGELPQVVEGNNIEAGEYERALVITRLDWFKQRWPAAYYAAALSLAEATKRTGLAEAVRQAKLTLKPPALPGSKPHFTMTDETTITSGLATLMGWEKAEELPINRGFATLDELVQACHLSKEEWERLAWSGALDNFGAREALVEAANELAEVSQAWYERQSQMEQPETSPAESDRPPNNGQLSLFDFVEPATEETPSEPELRSVELPAAVTLLSPLQRLRNQFTALGFYTVEHPLWQQLPPVRPDNSRSDTLTLQEAIKKATQEGEGAGEALTLAGMVVGLRRLPFTEDGQGQELTVVRLEDWTGQLELLIPPTLKLSLELAEGMALTALARRLKNSVTTPEARPILVAEAVTTYPAEGQLISNDTEATDLAALENSLAESDLDLPFSNEPPSGDDGWASSLFADLGVVEPKPAPANPLQEATRPRNGGKNGGQRNAPPRPLTRHVHIKLEMSGNDAADNQKLNQLKDLLRQFPGDDMVYLYLRWPDGETNRLQPQSLNVAYNPEFAAQVTQLLGGNPDTVTAEER